MFVWEWGVYGVFLRLGSVRELFDGAMLRLLDGKESGG